MGILLDVRRTIEPKFWRKCTATGPTGSEIIEAVKKLAENPEYEGEYAEQEISDIDGVKTMIVGIHSKCPYKNVMIGTEPDLRNIGIRLKDTYSIIGVRSSNEILEQGYVKGEAFPTANIALAVEKVRDGLEKLLR